MSKITSGKLITFVGGIGSGKTTAANLVARELNFLPLNECYEENAFLPLFYKNMPRWAFHSQLVFLVQKSKQLINAKELLQRNSFVADCDIIQDLCYMDTQKTTGTVSGREYFLYYEIYDAIKQNLPEPNLIVYLQSTPGELKKRIEKRGRDFEKKITVSYLENLIKAIEKKLEQRKKLSSVVVVRSDELNFLENNEDKKLFLRRINENIERV